MLHRVHLHFLGEVNFNSMPTGEEWTKWMRELVSILDMNIMFGPEVLYCDTPGNEGHTGICVIDTSHLSFHAWEEGKFAKMDIYSCKHYAVSDIFAHLAKLDISDVSYTLVDRGAYDEPAKVLDRGRLDLVGAAA